MHSRRGQGFLAFVLLIGVIVLTIAITLALIAGSSVNSIYAYRYAARAQAVALSGVEDALMQLERNTAFSAPSGYTLTVASDTATITVTQSSTSSPPTATVVSTATVNGSTKSVTAVVNGDSTTGSASIQSMTFTQ